MKLQIATDIANTETVFSIADAVHDVIDVYKRQLSLTLKYFLQQQYAESDGIFFILPVD